MISPSSRSGSSSFFHNRCRASDVCGRKRNRNSSRIKILILPQEVIKIKYYDEDWSIA